MTAVEYFPMKENEGTLFTSEIYTFHEMQKCLFDLDCVLTNIFLTSTDTSTDFVMQ